MRGKRAKELRRKIYGDTSLSVDRTTNPGKALIQDYRTAKKEWKATDRIRKKSLAKTIWKRAFNACEQAMYAAVKRRDKVCVLCGSSEVLQAHHAIIGRQHKSTFFEIKQMTTLCSKCHLNATFKNNGKDIQAAAVVAERECYGYLEEMYKKSLEKKKWNLEELETMKSQFEGMYRENCN